MFTKTTSSVIVLAAVLLNAAAGIEAAPLRIRRADASLAARDEHAGDLTNLAARDAPLERRRRESPTYPSRRRAAVEQRSTAPLDMALETRVLRRGIETGKGRLIARHGLYKKRQTDAELVDVYAAEDDVDTFEDLEDGALNVDGGSGNYYDGSYDHRPIKIITNIYGAEHKGSIKPGPDYRKGSPHRKPELGRPTDNSPGAGADASANASAEANAAAGSTGGITTGATGSDGTATAVVPPVESSTALPVVPVPQPSQGSSTADANANAGASTTTGGTTTGANAGASSNANGGATGAASSTTNGSTSSNANANASSNTTGGSSNAHANANASSNTIGGSSNASANANTSTGPTGTSSQAGANAGATVNNPSSGSVVGAEANASASSGAGVPVPQPTVVVPGKPLGAGLPVPEPSSTGTASKGTLIVPGTGAPTPEATGSVGTGTATGAATLKARHPSLVSEEEADLVARQHPRDFRRRSPEPAAPVAVKARDVKPSPQLVGRQHPRDFRRRSPEPVVVKARDVKPSPRLVGRQHPRDFRRSVQAQPVKPVYK